MKKVEVLPDGLAVRFSVAPDQFQPVKNAVKSLSGSWWVNADKFWKVHNTPSNIARLRELGFELPTELEPVKAAPVAMRGKEPQKDIDENKLASLPYTLRDYQLQATRFAESSNWNCILALAPRLGKTVIALSGTLLHPEMLPVLIVCPASVKIIWQGEIKKCLNKNSIILDGTMPYEIPSKFQFVIINFDMLS